MLVCIYVTIAVYVSFYSCIKFLCSYATTLYKVFAFLLGCVISLLDPLPFELCVAHELPLCFVGLLRGFQETPTTSGKLDRPMHSQPERA